MTLFILLVVFVVALFFVLGLHTYDKVDTAIEIEGSASDVWATLVDFDQYRDWNPFITHIDGKAEQDSIIKTTIALPFKQSMDFNLKIKSLSEGKEMVWQGKTLEPQILDGEHYLRVESLPNNRVRFSQGEKFSGLLLYLTMPLIKGRVLSNFNAMNNALKDRIEGVEKLAAQEQMSASPG